MSDLQVPEPAYKRRVQMLEVEMTQIDERKELVCCLFIFSLRCDKFYLDCNKKT